MWWAASDIGWTVGHGYICYSPLLNANTTVMYEGKPVGTPDAGQFFRSALLSNNVRGCVTASFFRPSFTLGTHLTDIDVAMLEVVHQYL